MRAAIIGLGIGTVHAEVYDRRPEITAIALCDRDPAKLAEVAARLRKPVTCHASPEEMFAAGRVDLASVVTPDPCHRAHCEAAFAAGADVLVTKPLATALEDADAISGQFEAESGLVAAQLARARARLDLRQLTGVWPLSDREPAATP